MVKNHDAGDAKSLEEVFRSQEISRAADAAEGGSGTTTPGGRDDALMRRMLGHASSALRDIHRDDGTRAGDARSQRVAWATELDATLMDEPRSEAASSGGGAALGASDGAVSAGPPWKRQSGRYWTIAALSALLALVVAGVTAGTGQHGSSNRSALGSHGTARPHGGAGSPGTPGSASSGPTAPGSLTGSIGPGALALGATSAGARGPGNQPGGHVTLIGAATTTGTLPAPAGGSPGGGSPGGSTGSSGSNPVTPVAAGVGSTVATVGTSVSGLANQLGNTLPAAAPTSAVTSAVSGVLDSVDQAVSATTL
jgi:hypothetical protein